MELRKPPPVRRLTGDEIPAPPSTNGNGRHPTAAFALPARRAARDAAIAIDRMQVESLSVSYGNKPAVKSVSLPIRQGEVLALIGPSGCGKTTLLRSLNRLT